FPPPLTLQTYTLSLHDALPISRRRRSRPPKAPLRLCVRAPACASARRRARGRASPAPAAALSFAARASELFVPGSSASARGRRRSEEHTSELQSLRHLVCRLLL